MLAYQKGASIDEHFDEPAFFKIAAQDSTSDGKFIEVYFDGNWKIYFYICCGSNRK